MIPDQALLHNAFYGNYIVRLVAALGFGYLMGSIPLGPIARWLFAGLDPRLGRLASAAAVLLTVVKGCIPTAIALHGGGEIVGLACGLATTIGHYYCPWTRFRGGRSVDLEAGVVVAISPVAALIFLAFWATAARSSRSAAIGTIFASALLFLPLWYFVGPAGASFGIAAGTAIALRVRIDGQALERA